jgi:hypothetical protein
MLNVLTGNRTALWNKTHIHTRDGSSDYSCVPPTYKMYDYSTTTITRSGPVGSDIACDHHALLAINLGFD